MGSIIDFNSCFLQGNQDNLFKFLQTNFPILIGIHHPHVAFHIIMSGLKIHPSHIFVRLLQNTWNFIFCQISWVIPIEHLKQPPRNIKSSLCCLTQFFLQWIHMIIFLHCYCGTCSGFVPICRRWLSTKVSECQGLKVRLGDSTIMIGV